MPCHLLRRTLCQALLLAAFPLVAAWIVLIQAVPTRAGDAPAVPHGLHARMLLDGFEDPAWPNPDLWTVSGSAAPTWWPSTCRARSGRRALWAFGGQVGGGELACGAGAPFGASSTIVQRLDLRGAQLASRLELHFELWMQLPPGPDTGLFIFLRAPQPGGGEKRVPVFGATGGGGDWVFPVRQLDLMSLADISDPREVYDLRGGIWELEWVALAPNGTAPGAGVFIDDVALVWEPDPAVTPPTPRPTSGLPTGTPTMQASATATPTASATVRPASATPLPATATSTASSTPTSTRRATPSDEDTPTPRPTGARAYLPWAAQGEVLRADTPTPEVPGTPTTETPIPTTETATPTSTETPKPPPLYLPWTAWEAVPVDPTPEPTAEDPPDPTQSAVPDATMPILRVRPLRMRPMRKALVPGATILGEAPPSQAIGERRRPE